MSSLTEYPRITSIKDQRIIEARELTSASGRARWHKMQLEGEECIQWALDAGLQVEHVFVLDHARQQEVVQWLQAKHIPCYLVSEGILKKISETSYLIPVVGIAALPTPGHAQQLTGDLVVVLDHIQDHGNLGTIIRTARAFGIHDLISTTPDLDLYFKKIVSASRGKAFEVSLHAFATARAAITTLKEQGYQIVATSPHARDIQAMAPLQQKPLALVVGNETEGVAPEVLEMADVVVQIPMSGMVESLNVGVATGISLYELKFRMILAMLTRFIRASFGREVNVTGQMIMQVLNHELQKVTDLNNWQVVLLMMLACDRQMSRAQAGRETATFGAELDSLLEPLLARGYLIQDASSDLLKITSEGERTIAQLWSTVERAEHLVLAGFSAEEKAQLIDYLKRIQQNCNGATGQ